MKAAAALAAIVLCIASADLANIEHKREVKQTYVQLPPVVVVAPVIHVRGPSPEPMPNPYNLSFPEDRPSFEPPWSGDLFWWLRK